MSQPEEPTQTCVSCGSKCGTRYKLVLYGYSHDNETDQEVEIEISPLDKEGNEQYLCCECAA